MKILWVTTFAFYALNYINLKIYIMKKRNLKNLSLSKSLVSDLNSETLAGGAANSFRLADCPGHPSAIQTCQYSCLKSCYCLKF